MACWECLLSPQCVFTEPNSFLGRNGASLRNMCTTHLLPLSRSLSSLTHTHTHTHRKHALPPPNNKSNLWYLGFGSSASSNAARWHVEAATSECDVTSPVTGVNGSDEAKNKVRGESLCATGGWANARRARNEWTHDVLNGYAWHVATKEICERVREQESEGDDEVCLD